MAKVSHRRLLSVLDYDADTGIMIWKKQLSGRRRAGTVAGSIGGSGYWRIRIDGVEYLAHHLAWFYVYGVWPKRLDHKDTDKLNNRILNLRPATVSQNAANKRRQKNISGFKGVQKRPNDRWRAIIETRGKSLTLGTFGTPEEASAAYFKAAKRLFGEFARV
jgi:Demerecviridae HNH endonuclease